MRTVVNHQTNPCIHTPACSSSANVMSAGHPCLYTSADGTLTNLCTHGQPSCALQWPYIVDRPVLFCHFIWYPTPVSGSVMRGLTTSSVMGPTRGHAATNRNGRASPPVRNHCHCRLCSCLCFGPKFCCPSAAFCCWIWNGPCNSQTLVACVMRSLMVRCLLVVQDCL